MAEDNTDKSQKTEEPTQKRLEDSRRKGQVANSREVNHWFMILGAAIVVIMVAPTMMSNLKGTFRTFIEQPHAIPADSGNLTETVGALLRDVGLAMLIPLLLLLVAALASGIVQSGLIFAPERIKPKLDKISLKSGIKRLFSMRSFAEFIKGLFKISIVATVAAILMLPEFGGIDTMIGIEGSQILARLHELIARLLIGVLAIVTVIAILDFLYQKFEHLKSMRMSRQEIRDEMKQTEGDPIIRQRLRQIRAERARRRMMAAVPGASVVVTNPTHYAVALKYEMTTMTAPVLVAKGIEHLALRIREVARENGVPVVENPPIAQALYATVEIDEEVPPEHYKVVAEIIGYVMRLKGKLK